MKVRIAAFLWVSICFAQTHPGTSNTTKATTTTAAPAKTPAPTSQSGNCVNLGASTICQNGSNATVSGNGMKSSPPTSPGTTVAGAYSQMANAYRTAATGACTAAAKSCYLQQAQYYDCLNSTVTQAGGGCIQPAACVSSGCTPGQAGTSQPSSSVVTFNKGGSVTTQIVPEGGRPPQVLTFGSPVNSATMAGSLVDRMEQVQAFSMQSQAMVQSLATALDRQMSAGNSHTTGNFPSPVGNSGPDYNRPNDQQSPQNSQDLAQRLLDRAASQLAPPDPLQEGANAVFGRQLGQRVVDQLVDRLDRLGVDENSLQDPNNQARFQLNNAINPFNLRKGTYEYNKGMIDGMINALDRFFPAPGNQ